MNNKAIQILRGSKNYNPNSNDISDKILDGQPFYSKYNKLLYVGDNSYLENNDGNLNEIEIELKKNLPVGAANLIPLSYNSIKSLNNFDLEVKGKNQFVIGPENSVDYELDDFVMKNIQEVGNCFVLGESNEITNSAGAKILGSYNKISNNNSSSFTINGEPTSLKLPLDLNQSNGTYEATQSNITIIGSNCTVLDAKNIHLIGDGLIAKQHDNCVIMGSYNEGITNSIFEYGVGTSGTGTSKDVRKNLITITKNSSDNNAKNTLKIGTIDEEIEIENNVGLIIGTETTQILGPLYAKDDSYFDEDIYVTSLLISNGGLLVKDSSDTVNTVYASIDSSGQISGRGLDLSYISNNSTSYGSITCGNIYNTYITNSDKVGIGGMNLTSSTYKLGVSGNSYFNGKVGIGTAPVTISSNPDSNYNLLVKGDICIRNKDSNNNSIITFGSSAAIGTIYYDNALNFASKLKPSAISGVSIGTGYWRGFATSGSDLLLVDNRTSRDCVAILSNHSNSSNSTSLRIITNVITGSGTKETQVDNTLTFYW